MITIQHRDKTYSPVCICDICRERITDADQAIVLYQSPRGPGQGEFVSMLQVHKGECDRQASKTYGDDGGTEELSTLFVNLLHNIGL